MRAAAGFLLLVLAGCAPALREPAPLPSLPGAPADPLVEAQRAWGARPHRASVERALRLVLPAAEADPAAQLRLGILLGRVISPIAIGIVFFGVLTPTAVRMRWRGKDPLRLGRASSPPSYWLPRAPPGPPPLTRTHTV